MPWNISVKTRPTPWDALVLLVLLTAGLLLSLLLYGQTSQSVSAVVRHRGVQITQVHLSALEEVYRLPVEGEYHLTLCFDRQGVWVEKSNCPTQDCLHTGKIIRSGQSIVCLPEQVVVELQGEQADGFDAVLG